jgi:outer membrane biosynthesis protein TonB
MLIPLTVLALLAGTSDAGAPVIAPVNATPDPRIGSGPGAAPKPVEVSQLPFTPDSIAQVVRAHQPEIQDCYEKTLAARNEKLQGQLMTHFVITAAGTVTGAQVVKRGTTLKDKDLNTCVVGVLGKLHFPKPPDGKQHPVEYPFNLQPVE